MLRGKSSTVALGLLAFLAAGGAATGQTVQALSPDSQDKQAVNAGDAGVSPAASPVRAAPDTATPAASPASTPTETPLSPEQQKAAESKAALDRLLSEAAALKGSYEDYRKGRSKTPASLSSFRSMELRLQMAAAVADPADTRARDMANDMRMIQYGILQPSVRIAAVANRQLYAHEMSERMRDDGLKVEASGRENSTVRFTAPHMTKQIAMQLVETAKIPEQARALQFRRVVFGNGRRSWTYNVERGRLR